MTSLSSTTGSSGVSGHGMPLSYLSEKYDVGAKLGGGSYGSVYFARSRESGRECAIKHIHKKYQKWEECLRLRECLALSKLPRHENVVRLIQVIHNPQHQLFFVFEFMQSNLHDLITHRGNHRQIFQPAELRVLMHDILSALAFIHRNGFFHRDIKPENLLLTDAPANFSVDRARRTVLKVADFGEARGIRAVGAFTDYVSTRWYRAPELLLHARQYNSPIDIFAAGAVMAEIFTLTPLFPGRTAADQIDKVFSLLGSPVNLGGKKDGGSLRKITSRFGRMWACLSSKRFLPLKNPEQSCLSSSLLWIH